MAVAIPAISTAGIELYVVLPRDKDIRLFRSSEVDGIVGTEKGDDDLTEPEGEEVLMEAT